MGRCLGVECDLGVGVTLGVALGVPVGVALALGAPLGVAVAVIESALPDELPGCVKAF